jgi:deazaflavin-dependent oxidoreductase (nitroreductase family)
LGEVVHQGRRSGRVYEPPVNVFPTSDGVRIALTYGVHSDWVNNVLAAGGCCLRARGHKLVLTSPQVVHDPMLHGTRPVERQILRLLRVADFLTLLESDDVVEGST